mmetsp:Transcript_4347/g.9669  ORF Transcript_4347/g.9669 Transcript_4347/m.9669 type:complete len:200 (+) Transcript_4347:1649-2248(+)
MAIENILLRLHRISSPGQNVRKFSSRSLGICILRRRARETSRRIVRPEICGRHAERLSVQSLRSRCGHHERGDDLSRRVFLHHRRVWYRRIAIGCGTVFGHHFRGVIVFDHVAHFPHLDSQVLQSNGVQIHRARSTRQIWRRGESSTACQHPNPIGGHARNARVHQTMRQFARTVCHRSEELAASRSFCRCGDGIVCSG